MENPKDFVIPILVETKDKDNTFKPFSTLESEIEWVLN